MTLDLTRPTGVHLVGIGGAGMSGLARILLLRGHVVTGSDQTDSRALDELEALGAKVRVGHHPDAIGPVEAVVASTAVDARNPELVAARDRGLPILRRAELLAALMVDDRRILVAGTHGKTTTTSMTAVALQAAGADPSFAIGGQLNETGTNAHAGSDGRFIAEADESDRSLLVYSPDIAVVTNVELDHPDEFASLDDVREVFSRFLGNLRPGGTALLCADDADALALASHAGSSLSYGESPGADFQLVLADGDVGHVHHGGVRIARMELKVPGRHNQINATAAIAIAVMEGLDPQAAADGLATFTGAARRFQLVGQAQGITVVDDYAHHPTELRVTLAAARSQTQGRIVVVVQPHRYSRTRVLGEALGQAAAAADVVIVTDVYAASEPAEPGVTGRLVADAAQMAGARVVYQPHLGRLVGNLVDIVEPGDTVLVTGAGDVSQVGPALLVALRG